MKRKAGFTHYNHNICRNIFRKDPTENLERTDNNKQELMFDLAYIINYKQEYMYE
jgi:hypothetical protein